MKEELVMFEDTVSYKLARVTTAFRTALEKHMALIHIHSGQVFIFFELWREDGLSQVDIATRLNVKAPTVNKMLKGLIVDKYIKIIRQKGKRESHVFLTESGYDLKKDVSEQWVELEAEYLSGITDNERHILLDILGKLKTAYTGRDAPSEDD